MSEAEFPRRFPEVRFVVTANGRSDKICPACSAEATFEDTNMVHEAHTCLHCGSQVREKVYKLGRKFSCVSCKYMWSTEETVEVPPEEDILPNIHLGEVDRGLGVEVVVLDVATLFDKGKP